MENLNAEQINDILDKMEFFQGQRAGRELWNDKPFEVQEQDIANFSRDVALLKNYIKELTEENEVRKRCNTMLNNELRRIDNIKADTVRSMRSRIKARCIAGGIYPAFVENVIDQIAKEMLEET